MIQTGDLQLYKGEPFGNIMLKSDFSEMLRFGFHPGDSVNVYFNNGMTLEDIPYLSGCVLPEGMICLNAITGFDWIRIEKRFGKVWDFCKLSGNETARIVLREPQKYSLIQDCFSTTFSLAREDFPCDEIFTNYRELSGGMIAEGNFYRSTGSFDPIHNTAGFYIRQTCLDRLLERDQIQFILNMTCSKEEMDELFDSGKYKVFYTEKLYREGKIFAASFPADYTAPAFRKTLAAALRVLMEHRGPYLIQCRAGLDRTGFLCCILEALAGADRSEILYNCMRSYECICNLTKESDPQKYAILRMFQADRNLEIMTRGESIERSFTAAEICSDRFYDESRQPHPYTDAELSASAENYLRQCGLSEAETAKLKALLTVKIHKE